MGKLPNGIHGPVRGKVGTIVGSSWKGIDYIKVKPRKRSKIRAEGEKLNQDRFKALHQFLQPMLVFLREGFRGYAGTLEGFNAAKSYNLKHAFRDGDLDPSLVLVSHGTLPLPENIQCRLEGYDIEVTWDTDGVDPSNKFDQVMILVYEPNSQQCRYSTIGEFRKTGKDVLKHVGRSEFHVYVAFKSHDRKRQSNSAYLGKVNV